LFLLAGDAGLMAGFFVGLFAGLSAGGMGLKEAVTAPKLLFKFKPPEFRFDFVTQALEAPELCDPPAEPEPEPTLNTATACTNS
jgi:hypothetical protein